KFNLLITSFSKNENLFDFENENINYARDILGSDALRVNSSFETNMKKTDKLYYKRLNSQFMHINTTFFSLRNTLNNNKNNSQFIDSLKKIYTDFENCLSNYSNSNNLPALINELKKVKGITKIKIEEEKKSLDLDDFDLIHDFNTITSFLLRLESEIYDYCNTYYGFTTNSDKIKRIEKFSENLKFSTYSDNVLISLMIVRASITLIVVITVWIISGWEYGSLAVLPAVANTLLLSTAPNPVGATKNFLKGAAVGFIITPIYNFYIIPMYVSDLFTLCLFLTPVLAGISLFMILPGKNLIGFGFLLIFIMTCAINTQYNMSFDTFMDMNIATVIGLLFSGTSFVLINFTSNIWIESRVKKALSKQIEITTKDKLALQRVRLESAGFDLIQRYSALGRLDNKSNNKIFRWVLLILEIGKAIINIRKNATLFTKPKPQKEINKILILIRKYFDLKNKNNKENQMEKIKELINQFEQVHLQSANDQKLLKDIYLDFSIIYSLMKNKEFLPIKEEMI
ncbi:FUSC family protein, partial [Arcobacter sp.]|uniref:FUSC family protein n=1 Tax=Arcobacter sp. TaxID=1872629 RepID=UPI003D11A88F